MGKNQKITETNRDSYEIKLTEFLERETKTGDLGHVEEQPEAEEEEEEEEEEEKKKRKKRKRKRKVGMKNIILQWVMQN